jgi:hypothetical protein
MQRTSFNGLRTTTPIAADNYLLQRELLPPPSLPTLPRGEQLDGNRYTWLEVRSR